MVLTFLAFGTDSSFQNLSEFICAILAVMGQIALGLSGQSMSLRGDSMTALTWSITERVRGTIVTNASMVWTLLCVAADINVQTITHIAGEDNKNCDRLSRRRTHSTMSVIEEAASTGIKGVRMVEMNGDESVMGVLRQCDPRRRMGSEEEFVEFWSEVRAAIATFLRMHTPHNTIRKGSVY